MNHADVKRNLADYLEGDLGLEERAFLDAHLDGCPDCAREVAEMQETVRLLRAMPEPETPPMIAANVMRRIRAGETEPGFFGRIARRLRGRAPAASGRARDSRRRWTSVLEPSFILPASAIAAAALVVAVLQPGGRWQPAQLTAVWEGDSADAIAPSARQGAEASVFRSEASRLASEASVLGPEASVFGSEASRRPATRPRTIAQIGPGMGDARSRQRGAAPATVYTDAIAASPASTAFVGDLFAPGSSGLAAAAPPRTAVRLDRNPVVARSPRPLMRPGGVGAQTVSQPLGRSALPSTAAAAYEGPGWNDAGSASENAAATSSGIPARRSLHDDPRDPWIARGLEDPAGFARFLSEQSLAEQELWVSRLAERAVSRGLLDELVAALKGANDETANWLASDFAAQLPGGETPSSQ